MRASVRTPWLEADLACEPGQVVAVTGPNGAGKSTLLRALAGVLASPSTLEVGGREVSGLPPYRRDVGWVPQAPSLLPRRTARDDVAYPLRARGMPRAQARAAAQEQLDALGVGHLATSRGEVLSGGQAARVVLARALVHAPSLLLLDEPFASVDVPSQQLVRRVVRDAVSRTSAVALLVTHDPADVAELADQVLVLDEGRVVSLGS